MESRSINIGISFRHSIGYVPQEDVMHRDLTVYETLVFCSKDALPRDLPEQTVRRYG